MKNQQLTARQQVIEDCENIIVKVGTRLLTDTQRIAVFIAGINAMRKKGKKVLLVTSGAVGLGMQQLGLKKRPSELAEVQAMAAIGQSKLMELYEQECRKFGFLPAQLLLTAEDLRNRERHLNVLNCINSLWTHNVLPVINENDSVSVDELKFGDNDILSALLAAMTRTKLTIILTTEEGLREKVDGKLAGRVSLVEEIDDNLRNSASGTDNSMFSIGGMISKLRAAEIVVTAGDYLWIADGRKDSTLEDILSAKDIGTLFVPSKKHQLDSKNGGSNISRAATAKSPWTRERLKPSNAKGAACCLLESLKSAENSNAATLWKYYPPMALSSGAASPTSAAKNAAC
jgi:glutamate 5-kinase